DKYWGLNHVGIQESRCSSQSVYMRSQGLGDEAASRNFVHVMTQGMSHYYGQWPVMSPVTSNSLGNGQVSPSDHESKDDSWYPMKTHYNARCLELREFGPEDTKGYNDSW
ncbi:hypothetical protein HAX54_002148, partial [Datura stramonium]|nr:hypothetical protein [Datura stramonium]